MQSNSYLTTHNGPWATFFLDDEIFAVSAQDVQEVMMQQPLTPVPLAPDHIIGLLNLRGQVMPAIDLRRRLQFEPRPTDKSAVFIVVKAQGNLVSVVVDNVGDVVALGRDRWHPPPDTLSALHRSFIFGICPLDGRTVMGLKVDAMSGEVEPTGKDVG